MKKIYILIFAMLLISGMVKSAQAKLLFNGDAEQGDTSGWNNPYPLAIQAVQISQVNKPLDPFAGDYFFSFSEVRIGPDNSVSMSQRGFLTSGVNSLTLSGYFTTEIQDFGEATLSIYDMSDNIISTVLTGPLNIDPEVFVWTYFEISLPVPTDASYWQVDLKGTVKHGGHANVYWDNIELNPTSTPPPPPTCPEDNLAPSGSVHAYPNLIWPPNNKMVTVAIEGWAMDELSILREGGGHGVSSAYLLIDGTDKIILFDDTTDLLDADGHFSIDIEVKASKGAEYHIELYGTDKNPDGPNSGLVDTTYIQVPHNMN